MLKGHELNAPTQALIWTVLYLVKVFNGGIILLRNNKPGEQEEIIEPVAGTLSSHVTRVGLEILQGGGGGSNCYQLKKQKYLRI